MTKLYQRTSHTGVGFETHAGGFWVPTLFRESAFERARQEFASGRDVVSAAIYENGKCLRIVDWRDYSQVREDFDPGVKLRIRSSV